jgi:anti-sigma B factor antagonist
MSAGPHGNALQVVVHWRPPRDMTLVVAGELDIATAPLLEAKLEEARDLDVTDILVDVHALKFCDAAGTRPLRSFVSERGGKSSRIVGATGVVRRVLELLDLVDDRAGS